MPPNLVEKYVIYITRISVVRNYQKRNDVLFKKSREVIEIEVSIRSYFLNEVTIRSLGKRNEGKYEWKLRNAVQSNMMLTI